MYMQSSIATHKFLLNQNIEFALSLSGRFGCHSLVIFFPTQETLIILHCLWKGLPNFCNEELIFISLNHWNLSMWGKERIWVTHGTIIHMSSFPQKYMVKLRKIKERRCSIRHFVRINQNHALRSTDLFIRDSQFAGFLSTIFNTRHNLSVLCISVLFTPTVPNRYLPPHSSSTPYYLCLSKCPNSFNSFFFAV